MAPLSRLMGATLTRAAICFRSSIPNSGKCASSVGDTCRPTPGTECSRSSCSRYSGLRRSRSRSSWFKSSNSCRSQVRCPSMMGRTAPVAHPKRFLSATSMVITWLHLVDSELSPGCRDPAAGALVNGLPRRSGPGPGRPERQSWPVCRWTWRNSALQGD